MPSIAPTITAESLDEYRRQLNALEPFAHHIHIDLMDGMFAPTKSVRLDQIWWPDTVRVDVHMMFKHPEEELDLLVSMRPYLVIVHAESQGDFGAIVDTLQAANIKVGVALLQPTSVKRIAAALDAMDHVLVFSGNLGHQGGSAADLALLDKVRLLRELKPELEIGWDGGINADNVRMLAENGVDVLNVGGYVMHSHNRQLAYEELVEELA
jgi:ribulose-phosphate 3-epimerase